MNADNKSLDWFRKMFAEYPPLTTEEEKAMIKKYSGKKNREKLEELLVLHNLALIPGCVKKYVWAFDDKTDAWMFGVQALVKCAKTFDPKKNCKFNTWAYDMIWRQCARRVKDWHNEIDDCKVSLDAPGPETEDDSGEGSTWRSLIESQVLDKYKIDQNKPFESVSEQSVRDFTSRLLRLAHVPKKYIDGIIAYWLDGKTMEDCAKMVGTSKPYMQQQVSKARHNIWKGLTVQIESDLIKSGQLEPRPCLKDFEHKITHEIWRNGKIRTETFTLGCDWLAYDRAYKKWELKKAALVNERRGNLKGYIQ